MPWHYHIMLTLCCYTKCPSGVTWRCCGAQKSVLVVLWCYKKVLWCACLVSAELCPDYHTMLLVLLCYKKCSSGVTWRCYGAHAWLALSYAYNIILCWGYIVTQSILMVSRLLDSVMVLQKYSRGFTWRCFGVHALSYAYTIKVCYWCYYVTKSVLVVLLDGVTKKCYGAAAWLALCYAYNAILCWG